MKILSVTFTTFIVFWLALACQPIEVKKDMVGPILREPFLVEKREDNPRKYDAYLFLKESKDEISQINIEEERERMNEPEEVKFVRRMSELKEIYNDAVNAYRKMGEDNHTYKEFLSQKSAFQKKKDYLIRNFGI